MENINKSMAKGAAWMVLFKLVERSIGVVSTVILARLLMPSDFGLIAMATSLIAVVELLGAFNFDAALIQNRQADKDHYDTAWTFNVLYGIVGSALLISVSWVVADFYHEPRLQQVISCLSLTTMLGGFENIGVVIFRKEMRFDKEFKFLLAKKLISFVVTAACAWYFRSYWALVAGMLTGRVSAIIISYLAQPYRPRLTFSKRVELFRFTRWLMINNILFFIVHRSSDFIIGKMVGPDGLGTYNIAYEISNLPTTELVAPINRAVFPGYSKIAGDLDMLRKSFIDVTGIIALISVPAGVGVATLAYPLVTIMLGEKWLNAIPIVEILAFFGVILSLQTNIGPIFIALGKPHTMTFLAALYVAILIPLVLLGLDKAGTRGAALAFLSTAVVHMPITVAFVAKTLEMSVWSFLGAVWRPLMASGAMYVLVKAVLDVLAQSCQQANVLSAAVGVLTGVLTYTSAALGLWIASGRPVGPESALLDQAKHRLARIL